MATPTPPTDGREKAKESGEPLKQYGKEVPFQQAESWQMNTHRLLTKAMGQKYEQRLSKIINYIDGPKAESVAKQTHFIELKEGNVFFRDENHKTLASFDVGTGMHDVIEDHWRDNTDLARRRSQRLRIYEFRTASFSDTLMRLMSERKKKESLFGGELTDDEKRAALERPKAGPGDPQGEAENRRLRELFDTRAATRGSILQSAEKMNDGEYDILASVSDTIKDDDAAGFERHWKFMDYSNEIDDLFQKSANPKEGYSVNPFKSQGWNHERLRDLIQKGSNGKLYFDEVGDELYGNRFEDFKKNLKKMEVPDEVIKLLDRKLGGLETMFSTDSNRSRPDTLQNSYKKLKDVDAKLTAAGDDPSKLPENLKALYPHRKKLKEVLQILGDYIAYATRLVNLMHKLRYNAGKKTEDRERTMQEFDRDANGEIIESEKNHVKDALHEFFLRGYESPFEYTSELRHMFSFLDPERVITFQDLNGQTATIRGEWFLEGQSADTAYKLAFEEIIKQTKNPDGSPAETVSEKDATDHLNHLLNLGISAYSALPGKRSLKNIIDGLEDEGAKLRDGSKLRFSGNLTNDIRSLYEVLTMSELNELYDDGTDLAKKINAERTQFVRIGSVIWQKDLANRQERTHEEREASGKTPVLNFSEEQADDIVSKLPEPQFTNEQKVKLKNALIGGAVIVLPKHGGGFFAHYEFENGTMIDVGASFPEWNAFAPTAAVGQKFKMSEDVTVTVNFGGGYAFSGPAEGWTFGPGGSISKKFKSIDIGVAAGVGMHKNGIIGGFVGIPINWDRSQEKYEATLSKKQLDAHIAELDKSGDPYEEVKKNPAAYPAQAQILYLVQNIEPKLDAGSERDVFMTLYAQFKEGVQREAIDDSTKRWYERFIPTGVTPGLAMVGPVPVPFLAFNFQIASRKLVYRMATDAEHVEKITDEAATTAIESAVAGAKHIETKRVRTSSELLLDPKTGLFMLKSTNEGKMDFSHLDKFGEFRDQLADKAKIFVEPAQDGLLYLNPREAFGNIEIYVDPKLGDDVVIVTRGARLYLSVKKDKEIYIKRSDITYPFKERGAVEKTTITISAEPDASAEVIENNSHMFFDRTPTTTWVRRPRSTEEMPASVRGVRQKNVQTWDEYQRWWGAGRTDRLEFMRLDSLSVAYDNLINSVALSAEDANASLELRPEVKKKIEALAKDTKFLQLYREKSTEGYDLIRANGKNIYANWSENFPELSQLIKEKVGQPLNPFELNAALMTLLIASFQNIQEKDKDPKKEYARFLEEFEHPMLCSIFRDYYKNEYPNETKREEKVNETVGWILAQLRNVDVTVKGATVESGTFFATLVGIGGITGMRHMYNYGETEPQYGLIGGRALDVAAKGTEGEVAQFWIRKLSPYVPGLSKEEYNKYQEKIHYALRSPLTVKLIPLIGVILTPDEMAKLTDIYSHDKQGYQASQRPINENNIGVVKKVLEMCDRVRTAELSGKTIVELDKNFEIHIESARVEMGIYKKCGNITGILHEKFVLIHKGSRQIYFAGFGEGVLDVNQTYARRDFSIAVGLALPIVQAQEVHNRPRQFFTPPKKHETPPPTITAKVPPTRPADVVPTPTPTPKPEPTPLPAEAPGAGDTGGNATGSTVASSGTVAGASGGE